MTKVTTKSGVYAIVNNTNGKLYVGSAHNLRKRWLRHQKIFGTSASPIKLRRAVIKHGSGSFAFRVLLLCSKQNCLFYEEKAIAALDAVANGYNCRSVPGSNIGIKLPMSEETKQKIGAAHRGQPRPNNTGRRGIKHTDEARAKMSATKRTIFRQYELNGESMCLSDWADRLDMPTRALQNRIARGWPLERALTEPSRGY